MVNLLHNSNCKTLAADLGDEVQKRSVVSLVSYLTNRTLWTLQPRRAGSDNDKRSHATKIISSRTRAITAQRLQHSTGKVASIPFRFKAGGSGTTMAPISAQSHHHRSTTKLNKKNFKSRHATKGSLKELSKGTDTQRLYTVGMTNDDV